MPAGATVTVYDADGNVIGTATNNGAEPAPVTVTIDDGLVDGQKVDVTLKESDKLESAKVNVTASSDSSSPLDPEKVTANATKDEVVVQDVPAGATIKVYDAEGNVIGTATNDGTEPGPVTVHLTGDLKNGDTVKVTVTEPGKGESAPISVKAGQDPSAPLEAGKATANATKDEVVVQDVPAGATINVYDAEGNVIGTATNDGTESGPVTVHLTGDLKNGDTVKVTVTESGKSESSPISVKAGQDPSAPLEASKATANATKDEVVVQDVPAGATIKVYDAEGNVIGTATNEGTESGPVTVHLTGDLKNGETVKVTITESGKGESSPISVKAGQDPSSPPEAGKVTANATKDEVVVQDVPAGATINVYDAEGNVIGTATNDTESGPVTVHLTGDLKNGDTVKVTVTEPGKGESSPISVKAGQDPSSPLEAGKATANATKDEVVVQDVPAGATIKVYDAEGNVIGTATNDGTESGPVTVHLTGDLKNGDTVKVTVTEPGKGESSPVSVTAGQDPSSPPEAGKVTANATKDEVVVQDVPAGATIKVYDAEGNVIGTATNDGTEAGPVTVRLTGDLKSGDTVKATVTETGKGESAPVSATAKDESLKPTANRNKLEENVFDRTLTVQDVPPGTAVRVYDEAGDPIGTAVNEGTIPATVVVTFEDNVLKKDEDIRVTFTEPGKLESPPYVKTLDITDDQYLNQDAKELSIGYTPGDTWESVTASIYVLTSGKYGSQIAWKSSKPTVVEIPQGSGAQIEGKVHRQASGETVIVTATLSKGGKTRYRTFLLVVKANGETKSEQSNTRNVEVKDGNDASAASVPVTRVTVSNSSTGKTSFIDKVVLTPAKAAEVVQKASGSVATILIDEPAGNAPDEVAVEIPADSVAALTGQGFSLNIETEHATLSLPADVLSSLGNNLTDLYFRLVPIKDDAKKKAIKQAIPRSHDGQSVTPTGDSLEIETNYSSFETTLTIPFAKNGIDPARLDTSKLRIYIAHSDGTTEFAAGTLVKNDAGNATGIRFKIDKFSTFTIVSLKSSSTSGGSTPTPSTDTVQAETSAKGTGIGVKLDIQRTKDASGATKDELKLTSQQAGQIAEEAAAAGVSRVTVTVPDAKDEVASTRIVLERGAADKLADAKVDLAIETSGGQVIVPSGSLAGGAGDVEIVLAPVRDKTKQQQIDERAAANDSVAKLSNGEKPAAAGRSVELDIGSLGSATVVVPLDASLIPAGSAERDVYLQSVIVYAEYKDGTAGTATCTIVDLGDGRYGIQIAGAKSGTYTALSVAGVAKTQSHSAYIKGYVDGTFRPNQPITRAELAALIARNLPAGADAKPASYPDVKAAHWAASYIDQVTAAGLMEGDTHGSFLPDANITRAEMAVLAARYLNLQASGGFADSARFADVRSHWAAGAIDAVGSADVMTGYADGTFGARKQLTRAEAVTIINRMLGRGPLYGVTASDWKDVPTTYWAFADIEEASVDHSYANRPEGGEQRAD
ncbi:S-layer homology domain-containing protein [Cohnella xylanilytica]|uniref:S-layer homology domain-containing protein n=1 Tax=Cohnella xylanilytica TaxID=557555 RepID=UPI002892E954|nr:S-layer homology domain-containing protein [Cohnella xylanilytica]